MLEAIAVILAIAFLLAVIMPMEGKVKPIAQRVVCGNNLKDLGTACCDYAVDYEDRFPQLPGRGPWSKKLGFAFDLPEPDFKEGGAQSHVDRTITASWYLLVRYADVMPKSFVCGASGQRAYDGTNSRGLDLVELWDFSAEPHKFVSYPMHNPYGSYPASGAWSPRFVVAADTSPWFLQGDFVGPDESNKDWRLNRTLLPPYFSNPSIKKWKIRQSNAFPHGREGQNVLFADGHMEYLKTTDVGMNHDNIYTFWSASENPTENDIRIGTNPTARDKDNDAKSADDSFLAI